MHFRHNAFGRKKGLTTVMPRDEAIFPSSLGISTTGTDFDFLHVNLLYCGGKWSCLVDAESHVCLVVPRNP